MRYIHVARFARTWGFIDLIYKLGSGCITLSLFISSVASSHNRLPRQLLFLTFRKLCSRLSFDVKDGNILAFVQWIQIVFRLLRRCLGCIGRLLLLNLLNLSIPLPLNNMSRVLVEAKPYTLPAAARILCYTYRLSIVWRLLLVCFLATCVRFLFFCRIFIVWFDTTTSINKIGQWLPGRLVINLAFSFFERQVNKLGIPQFGVKIRQLIKLHWGLLVQLWVILCRQFSPILFQW